MELCLYNAVFQFHLTVNLRVKCDEKPPFDAKKVRKQEPKLCGEPEASINNNLIREAVMLHYHAYYNLCKRKGIDDGLY